MEENPLDKKHDVNTSIFIGNQAEKEIAEMKRGIMEGEGMRFLHTKWKPCPLRGVYFWNRDWEE